VKAAHHKEYNECKGCLKQELQWVKKSWRQPVARGEMGALELAVTRSARRDGRREAGSSLQREERWAPTKRLLVHEVLKARDGLVRLYPSATDELQLVHGHQAPKHILRLWAASGSQWNEWERP